MAKATTTRNAAVTGDVMGPGEHELQVSTGGLPLEPVVSDAQGYFEPSQVSFEELLEKGGSEQQTIKIGDPSKGCFPGYLGQLIGAGPDVELNEKVSGFNEDGTPKTLPTWLFNPVQRNASGEFKVMKQITHQVICSTVLDQICKRLASIKANGINIVAAIKFDEVGQNRLGQPLNKYRCIEIPVVAGEI